eukprot:3260213-Rhodomonas_salina.2
MRQQFEEERARLLAGSAAAEELQQLWRTQVVARRCSSLGGAQTRVGSRSFSTGHEGCCNRLWTVVAAVGFGAQSSSCRAECIVSSCMVAARTGQCSV